MAPLLTNHKLKPVKEYKMQQNQTLLRATINGVFLSLSRLMDSMVWGSIPCIISMTRMAISQREEPRLLKLL